MFDLAAQALALNTYPLWVRLVVVAWVSVTGVGYALLLVMAPPAPPAVLHVNELRIARISGHADFTGFDIYVGNGLAVSAQITGMEMELYKKERPAGGLQSSEDITATYFVDSGGAHKVGSPVVESVTAERPYAGNDYTRLTLPLSQTVDAGKSDRFLVALKRGEAILPTQNLAAVTLIYNGGQKTVVKEVPLSP